MNATRYKLVFQGEIAPGHQIEEVRKRIANLYNVPVTKCDYMFTGKVVIIKDNLDYATAVNYKNTFEKAGACCNIEETGQIQANMSLETGTPPTHGKQEIESHSGIPFDDSPTSTHRRESQASSHKPQPPNSTNRVGNKGPNSQRSHGLRRQEAKAVPVSEPNIRDIPSKIQELLHESEQILYASRPSQNALTIGMIVNGIIYGIIGLSLYVVGIIVVLPIALLVTYYSWKNKYYIITDSRTIVSQGIFNVATKIINNKNIQIISINTGIIDRWLHLNSIQLSTAGQGGGASGILSYFPGLSKGSVTLKQVVVKDVIKHYYQ